MFKGKTRSFSQAPQKDAPCGQKASRKPLQATRPCQGGMIASMSM